MATMIFSESDERMKKTISVLKEDLQTIRAGRANPNMLNKVTVNYYGTPTPLKQMANISVPEPRTIQLTPWDKSAIQEIEKAILTSDLGLTPTNDGVNVRINIPQLTEERRKDLNKQVAKMGEDSKVAVRNIRRDANDRIKAEEKDAKISEDDSKAQLDEIQKLTDETIKDIDKIIERKQEEIREI